MISKEHEDNVICESCGGAFRDTEPRCPYCGSFHYKGAELEYLGKLEDVREDMEDLGAVPAKELRKEFVIQGAFVKKVLSVVFIVVLLAAGVAALWAVGDARDRKADYLWESTTFPVWDELYEQGDYEELTNLYIEAVTNDKPAYRWEHAALCSAMERIDTIQEAERRELVGEVLDQTEYAGLFFGHCWLYGQNFWENMPQEDKAIIAPYMEEAAQALKTRWQMSDEEILELKQKLQEMGYVPYDDCRKFVKEWYERNHPE